MRINWTLDDDKILVERVLFDKMARNRLVQDFEDNKFDWDEIAAPFDRSRRTVMEHWKRIVKPVLMTNEEGEEELMLRRELLEEIRSQGVEDRRQIDWGYLTKIFPSRSTHSLVRSNTWLIIFTFLFKLF